MSQTPPRAKLARGCRFAAVFAAFTIAAAALPADDRATVQLGAAATKKFVSATRDVAKAGRGDLAFRLIDEYRLLGGTTDAIAALTKDVNADLAKHATSKAKPKSKLPVPARALREVAREIAAQIATADAADKRAIARRALALDSSLAAAHEALGRVEHAGTWRAPGEEGRLARRTEIRRALMESKTLPIEIEVDDGTHPFVSAVCGEDAIRMRAHGLEIYSTFAPAKLERIVKTCLRATALANFVIHGVLEVPPLRSGPFLWLPTRAEYDRAIELARAATVDRIEARFRDHLDKLTGFFFESGFAVEYDPTEAATEAVLLGFLFAETSLDQRGTVRVTDSQAALEAGLHEWLCRTCLGTAAPRFIWFEGADVRHKDDSGSRAREDDAAQKLREEMLRMARGGIAGCRSYMAWRVRRGEDPPFANCLKAESGQLEGDEPLKVALVFEYLAETVDLLALFRGVADYRVSASGIAAEEIQSASPRERFERELGMSLDEFDAAWRDWLVPDLPGIADELDAAPEAEASTKPQKDARDLLNKIRLAALGAESGAEPSATELDPSLSDGCTRHARYLLRNRDQASAWPDAHEEYPDRDGFSVEGAFAGMHSVVYPGVASAKEAIDGWMATFYHRVPLLVPNVVRFGFALEGDIAVLDANSLAAPTPTLGWDVFWPPHGAKDIPTAFIPELPNPVPGEDQSKWGYPITVQRSERAATENHAVFELRVGDAKGPLVESYVSTPIRPTNPELAPAETYCLIPKAHLKSSTKYFASFVPPEGGSAIEWSFTTK